MSLRSLILSVFLLMAGFLTAQTVDYTTFAPIPLPSHSPPIDDQPNRLVQYSLSDQTELMSPLPQVADFLEVGDGRAGQLPSAVETPLVEPYLFSALQLVSAPEDPFWARNVKLFMTFPDGFSGSCSGAMIDAKHVLTAGHCVYLPEHGGWATGVDVVPGYENGSTPYGVAESLNLYSWTGWTGNQDYDWDMAYIQIDRPVGVLTGWYGFAYNNDFNFYNNNTFHNPGYPADGPYDGQYMYYWYGNYDAPQGEVLYHGNLGYRGQSGSNSHHNDGGDMRVHAILSHGTQPPNPVTGHVRINQAKFESIVDRIVENTADEPDLRPLVARGLPVNLDAGDQFTDFEFLVYNDAFADFNGDFEVEIYLSENSFISTQDLLIGSASFSDASLGSRSGAFATINNSLPVIPAGVSSGNYFVGVLITTPDANSDNNNTFGWDSFPVTITSAPPSLSVSPSSVSFGSSADNASINVSSNVNWSASDNVSWLSISGGSGSGNGSFSINATTNNSTSSRSATVTVSGGGISRTVSVSQSGQSSSLTVSPGSVNFGASADNASINVSSNVSWSASDNASWLSISGGSGSGNGNFTINATTNNSTSSRSATVTVSGGGISRTINVSQSGQSSSLTVSPGSVNFGASADNASISVSSNVSWSASDNASWLSISGGSGSGNGNFTINATANNSTSSRSATVTVSGGGISRTVSVSQAGQSSSLTVSPGSINFGASADNASINVSSNVSWSASDNASWLSISGGSGSGNGSFSINATSNSDCDSRSATVTVSGGGINRTIAVTQSGANASLQVNPLSLDVSADGGLESVAVSSNTSWQVSSASSWAQVASSTTGNGNGNFTLDIQANTDFVPRSTTVEVSTTACGFQSQTISITQAGNSLPIPWTPTETGDNHTVIIPNTANLQVDGAPLEPGDAIGFFYSYQGELYCSNYLIWTGASTSLAVYGNDVDPPAKNGFDNGEQFQVRVYRPTTETEYRAQVSFVPANEHPLVTHTNSYANDAISMIASLSASTQEDLTISLSQGWNMISSYVDPSLPNMLQLLSEIQSDVLLLKDEDGNTVIPAFSINNVGDWNLHKGYKIKMNQPAQLILSGEPAIPNLEPIQLTTGWQIIAYLRNSPQSAEGAFAPIASQLELVKNNSGETYIPAFNINTIGDLIPTQGYKVKVNQNTTLQYDNFSPQPTQRRLPIVRTELQHFQLDTNFNTGNNAVIVFPVERVPDWLQPGDEIGVFNQHGFLSGAVVVTAENFAMTVWGDDVDTAEIDGLQADEPYHFRLWQRDLDQEVELQLTMLSGDGRYAEDDVEIIAGMAIVNSLDDLSEQAMEIAIHPNPAQDVLFVSTTGQVEWLMIRDANGRVVQEAAVGADLRNFRLSLSGIPAGTYLLQVWDGEALHYQKFIKQ